MNVCQLIRNLEKFIYGNF